MCTWTIIKKQKDIRKNIEENVEDNCVGRNGIMNDLLSLFFFPFKFSFSYYITLII